MQVLAATAKESGVVRIEETLKYSLKVAGSKFYLGPKVLTTLGTRTQQYNEWGQPYRRDMQEIRFDTEFVEMRNGKWIKS